MNASTPLRERFLRDGCLHVPRALTAETVALALRCWQWSIDNPSRGPLRLFEKEAVIVEGLEGARDLPGREDGVFYQDAYNPRAREVYRELLRKPDLTGLLSQLLDEQTAWFFGEQVFLKEPAAPPTGWHQDISDAPIAGDDLIVFWIPFDAVDAETSLAMVPGSHRGPVYSSRYLGYVGEPIPDVDAGGYDVVSYACAPGDVVVLHLGILHGRAPTRPGQRRRSLSLRFAGKDAYFRSRANPNDPRNGQPFRRPDQGWQVLGT